MEAAEAGGTAEERMRWAGVDAMGWSGCGLSGSYREDVVVIVGEALFSEEL